MSDVKETLNTMFSGLDKSRVPTGYLWDVSVNMVEFEDYNGVAVTDSNYVSLMTFYDIIQSLNSSSVGADTLSCSAIISSLTGASSSNNVMIGMLLQPFNYIKANALIDNLIDYTSGIVSDVEVNGVWQNPYGEDYLFACAVGNENTVENHVTVIIKNVDSLSTIQIDSIWFDAGKGDGFMPISLGVPFDVHYTTDGEKEVALKVIKNGRTFLSHSILKVKQIEISPSSVDISNFTSTLFSAEYGGSEYHAMVTSRITAGFDNPLIVSEGFDPWRLQTWVKDTSITRFNEFSGYTNIENKIENTLFNFFASNYDVYYIDWVNCGADIRGNAEVLKAIIRWINGQKNPNTSNKNIVMGQSMGGLIARYALRSMEIDGESHQTKLFISHDVPYLGANVSPGLMHTYWDLFDLTDNWLSSVFFGYIEKTKYVFPELKKWGSYTSVKQMLPLYMNSSWQYDSTEYDSLQNQLNAMGFPRGDAGFPIENVAIVNGGKSNLSGTLSNYSSGDKILEADGTINSGVIIELLMMYLFKTSSGSLWPPGKTTLQLHHEVYPYLHHGDLIRTTTMAFKKKLLWLQILNITVNLKSKHAPSSGHCYDSYSSSCYYQKMPKPDTLGSFIIGTITYDVRFTDKLSFIPTASALAAPNSFEEDLYQNRLMPKIDTPFDGYILNEYNSNHISFFPGITGWLNQILNSTIVGVDVAFPGDVYSVTGLNLSGYTIKWSTSDDQIAAINESTGVITSINRGGMVDVVATCTKDGQVFSKRKTVLAGIPDMVISQSVSGNTFSAWTEIVSDAVREFAQTHGLDSLLTYNWYIDKWNTSADHTIENLSQHADSVSFSLGTSYAYANIGLNVIHGTDTLRVGPVSLRNADQFHINLFRIGYHNNQVSFIYYPSGEIPMSMNVGDPKLIIKPNASASPVGFTDVIPSYATVAYQSFQVTPHPFETGYYIIDAFSTYEGDSMEHSLAVFNVLWRIQHDDAILVKIYNSSGELLQTFSYVIDRLSFPIIH